MVRRFHLGIALRGRAAVLGLLLAAAIGCGSTKPARFYLLTATAEPAAGSEKVGPPTVVLGPIEVPAYLDRMQIVRRSGPNQVRIAEFDRWAEPLKDGIARVLAEDLSRLLPGSRVVPFGTKGPGSDCRATVEVSRLEGEAGGVALAAAWTVFGGDGKAVRSKATAMSVPLGEGGDEFDAMVAAESKALAGLAREIAEAIREVKPPVEAR
jgi:uncharacterized protein